MQTLPNVALSPKKELAARLIAQGYKQIEVARDERIKVTKQTMNTWCKEPEFLERVNDHRSDKTKQVEEILIRHIGEAADAVVEIAVDKPIDADGNPLDARLVSARLKAALWILERTMGKQKLPTPTKKEPEVDPFDADDDEIDDLLDAMKE